MWGPRENLWGTPSRLVIQTEVWATEARLQLLAGFLAWGSWGKAVLPPPFPGQVLPAECNAAAEKGPRTIQNAPLRPQEQTGKRVVSQTPAGAQALSVGMAGQPWENPATDSRSMERPSPARDSAVSATDYLSIC